MLDENGVGVKRRRSNPVHRWNNNQIHALLTAIKKEIEEENVSFESPSCPQFYGKIIAKTNELSSLNWRVLKSKIRNMRTNYKAAMEWKEKSGADLLAEGNEKSVTEYMRKVCPFWRELNEIFEGKEQCTAPARVVGTLSSASDNFSKKIMEYISGDDDNYTNIDEQSILSTPHKSKESSILYSEGSLSDMADIFEIDVSNEDEEEEPAQTQTKETPTLTNQKPTTLKEESKKNEVNTFSALMSMQQKRLDKEEEMLSRKLELEENRWIEQLKLEREKLEVKRKEIEVNERIALAKLDADKEESRIRLKMEAKKLHMEMEEKKLRLEMEERIKMYELRMKHEKR